MSNNQPATLPQADPTVISPKAAKDLGLVAQGNSALQAETPQLDNSPVQEQSSPMSFLKGVVEEFHNTAVYLGESLNLGEQQTQQSIGYYKALSGEIPTKEAQQNYSESRLDILRKQQVDETEQKLWALDVRNIAGHVTETLPFMKQVVQAAIEGGAEGAAIGGTTGLIGGLPAAVPTALIMGAWGAEAGAGLAMAKISAGGAYKKLIDEGVPEDSARKLATGAGIVMGSIAGMRVKDIGMVGARSLQTALGESTKLAVVGEGIRTFLLHTGIQATQATLQELTQITADTIGAYASGKPGSVQSWDQMLVRLSSAAITGAQVGVGATVGANVAGKTLGIVAKTLKSENPTLADGANLIKHFASTSKEADDIPVLEELKQEEPALTKEQEALQQLQEEHTKLSDEAELLSTRVKRLQGRIEKAKVNNTSKLANLRLQLIQTKEEQRAALEALNEIQTELNELAKAEKNKALAKLKKQLGRFAPKKIGKHKEGRLEHAEESNRQKVLDLFKLRIEDKEAFNKQVRKYIAVAENPDTEQEDLNDVTDDLHLTTEIDTAVGDLENKTGAQILRLTDKLKGIIDEGLKGRLAEITNRREKFRQLRAEVHEALRIKKPGDNEHLLTTVREAEAALKHTKAEDFRKWLNAYGQTIFSFKGKLKIAFQKSQVADELAAKLDTAEIRKLANKNTEEQQLKLMGYITEATKLSENDVIKLIVRGSAEYLKDDNGKAPKYLRNEVKNGKRLEGALENVTYNQGLYALMQMQNKKALFGLREGNGFTTNEDIPESIDTTEAVLKRLLAKKDKHYELIGKAIQDFYKQENGPRLGKYFRKDTGLELPLEKNYFGQLIRKGKKVEDSYSEFLSNMGLESAFQPSKVARKPGFAIERKDSKAPLVLQDPFFQALHQIDQTEHYGAWREVAKLYAYIFNDSDTRTLLEANEGIGFIRAIDDHLDDMINRTPIKNGVWLDTISTVLGRIGVTVLSLNPLRYLKHVTSVINFGLAEVLPGKTLPTTALLSGIAYYYDHSIEMNKTIESSSAFKQRYVTFGKTLVGDIRKADLGELQKRKFTETIMAALKHGDEEAVRAGFTAVYQYVLKVTGDKEQAMRSAEDAFNSVQYSNSVEQLSNAARNPYLKPITVFTQLPTRMFETEVNAWRKAINFPTVDNVYSALRISSLVRMSQFLFYGIDVAFVMAMPFYTDKEKLNSLWRMLLGAINGPAPMRLEELITPFEAITFNSLLPEYQQTVFEASDILFDPLKHAVHLYRKVTKAIVGGDFESLETVDTLIDLAHIFGAPDSPFKLWKHMADMQE